MWRLESNRFYRFRVGSYSFSDFGSQSAEDAKPIEPLAKPINLIEPIGSGGGRLESTRFIVFKRFRFFFKFSNLVTSRRQMQNL